MVVAVTGATGHIGNNICRTLLERGHSLKILIQPGSFLPDDLQAEKIYGNLADTNAIDRLLKNADAVCHSAAVISIGATAPEIVHRVNVEGTRNILGSAEKNGVKNLFYLSSIHAHESPGLLEIMDESAPLKNAGGAYDISKATAEREMIKARSNGLCTTIFNPTAVLGPHDYRPGLTGKMLLDVSRKTIPMLTPLGYDWVDVRDVAEAISTAIDNQVCNEKFFLSGGWRSIVEVAGIAASHVGVKPPRFTAPFWLAKCGVPFVGLYSRLSGQQPLYTYESLHTIQNSCQQICSDHAKKELNFTPRSLEETICDTIDWFRQNNYLS